MSYQKLGIVEFSKRLIVTEDIDPVYTMLYCANLDKPTLRRWLLAYLCYYHCGVASWCAEHAGHFGFHNALARVQINKWPRGSERRHFRGKSCDTALEYLRKWFPRPERAIESLEECHTFGELSRKIRMWPVFGPWVAFKAADIVERVLGVPIDFSDCEALYDSPTKGANEAYPGLTVKQAMARLLKELKMVLWAPPRFDRKLNEQEAETCFCKWHSHMSGHYPLGKDSKEILHALEGWGPLADRLKKYVPSQHKTTNRDTIFGVM